MEVLILLSSISDLSEKIWGTIREAVPEVPTEAYSSIDKYFDRLRRPKNTEVIAILQIDDNETLSKIRLNSELFSDVRTILILSNSDKTTLENGYKLRPRFIFNAHRDLETFAQILQNMADKAKKNVCLSSCESEPNNSNYF